MPKLVDRIELFFWKKANLRTENTQNVVYKLKKHVSVRTQFTLEELYNHVENLGIMGLIREHESLCCKKKRDTHVEFSKDENWFRNRYEDLYCYDKSRVKFKREPEYDHKTKTWVQFDNDYIHANFVNGYNHKNAFICTQTPVPATFCDFWCMIWQHDVRLIAMATRGELNMKSYWPTCVGQCHQMGDTLLVVNEHVEYAFEGFRVNTLSLTYRPVFLGLILF